MTNRKDYFNNYITTHFSANAVLDKKKDLLEFNTFDRNILQFLPKNKNAKVLEIGFGTGFFLKYLLKNNYRNIYGIELSNEETEFVKKNIYENVECVNNTEEFLDNHHNEYDFIIMSDVLEHIPKNETVTFLKKVKDALKKDSIFIAKVPNGSNPFNVQMFICDFTHEFIYSTESLIQVNKLAGFKKIQIFPQKEENKTWHSKITNITAPICYSFLKILVGLNRCSLNAQSFYTKNIFCVCKK